MPTPTTHPQPIALASRRGRCTAPAFTTIEVITAIAIMIVLMVIFVVAYRNVGGSSERNQTQALVDRLENALTEVTLSKEGAAQFYGLQLPSIYFPDPSNDFAKSNYKSWLGVPAGSLEAIARTGRVIALMSNNPNAKRLLDEVSTERKGKFVIGNQTYDIPTDAWGRPILFVFDNLQRPIGGGSSVPFTVNNGTKEVQVGGLTNVYSEAAKEYWEAGTLSPVPTYVDSTPKASFPQLGTYITRNGMTDWVPHKSPQGVADPTLRSPDHRPYWMSAGPDGKYETHDDNIYSFGN